MDIVESVSSAISIAKKLRELSKTIENVEFKMLLADLTNELADAKLASAEIKSKLADANERVLELQSKLETRETAQPSFDDGGYRFEGQDGLYCNGCFDSDGKKIRLSRAAKDFADVFGKWNCPNCKEHYG